MNRESFDRVVETMRRAHGLRMRGLRVCTPGGVFAHDFAGDPAAVAEVRSISKVVVSLAVGVAIADGVRLRGRPVSLDLEVWPFFADHLDRLTPTGRERLRAVRLRHLLTSTVGHAEGFLFRRDIAGRDHASLLHHVLDRDLVHPPGAHFAYSNAGWYLVSAMVTEALGVRLRDWASDLVLGRLGITGAEWVSYGRYDAGGTGLSLSADDLLTIGELFRDGGRHRGHQVVPGEWVEAVRSPAVAVPADAAPESPLPATSYGYGMWICDDGTYYCHGTGGRLLAVVPATGTVVVAVAEAGNTPTVARCLRGVLPGPIS